MIQTALYRAVVFISAKFTVNKSLSDGTVVQNVKVQRIVARHAAVFP
jgi:hypothetical protein